MYCDDELGKDLGHTVGYCVLTAQEGPEGGSTNLRNPRREIRKKIFSGNTISRTPAYAKNSKMVRIRGMLRFVPNHPLTLNNVKEDQRGSFYRRSLVVKMKGKFPPPAEYAALDIDGEERMGIFAKGDTLKPFLGSRPAAADFSKIIWLYESTYYRRLS